MATTPPSTTIKTGMAAGPEETLEIVPSQQSGHPKSNITATDSPAEAALSLASALKISEQMEMRQIELIYRAEGNANLVLALPQFKKVLRLPKTTPTQTRTSSISTTTSHQDISNFSSSLRVQQQTGNAQADNRRQHKHQHQQQQPEQPEQQRQSTSDSVVNQNAKAAVGSLTMQEFADYIEVLRRLVGNAYILDVDIVSIPNELDRRWINDSIRPHRPAHRLAKEFGGQFGLLLPDATQLEVHDDLEGQSLDGDTYAIEIKPKQGWLLPNNLTDIFHNKLAAAAAGVASDGVATEDIALNEWEEYECHKSAGRYCRYCAMQFLKLKNGKISEISSYCPMDLFSGVPHKMESALKALFACPQNNLRVFRNGVCVYGDNVAAMSPTIIDDIFGQNMTALVRNLVIESLLKDYTATGCELVKHTDAGNQQLPVTTQRSQTIEGLPKNCVLQKILHLQLLAKRNFNYMMASGFAQNSVKSYQILRTLLPKLRRGLAEEMLQPTEQYLLGATALDCSIMVAFREIPRDSHKYVAATASIIAMPVAGRLFVTKVAMLDLDPKPDSHFCKYLKQSQQAYQSVCELSEGQSPQ